MMAAASGAEMSAALAQVAIDEEAGAVASQAGALDLMPAIANIEQLHNETLSLGNLKCMGMGFDAGIEFKDVTTPGDKKVWLDKYVDAIASVDRARMLAKFPSKATANTVDKLAVKRSLRGLLDGLFAREEAIIRPSPPKVTVLKSPDDTVDFSNHEYDGTDIELAQQMCAKLFMVEFEPEHLPTISVLKKMSYSFAIERVLPGADRISLVALARISGEEPFLLLRRYLAGMVFVSAGAVADDVARHEARGHGKIGSHFYWLSWFDCQTLCAAFDFRTAKLSREIKLEILAALIEMMHALSGGPSPRPTGSAAVCAARQDLVRIVCSASVAAAAAAQASGEVAEAARAAALHTEAAAARGTPLGPNGLPRMKGGNPEGAACLDWAKGTCSGACSYSHAGKRGEKKKRGRDAPAAAEG